MPANDPLQSLPSILEDHIQEAEFLLRRTMRSKHETDLSVRAVLMFEERLGAHLEVLLEPSEVTKQALVESVESLSLFDCFLPDYCLLRLNHADTGKRITDDLITNADTIDNRSARRNPAHIKALCHAAPLDVVQSIAATQGISETIGLQLAEVLAFAGADAEEIRKRIKDYLGHKDLALRKQAWRAAQLAPQAITPAEGLAGVLDDDHDIRRLALEAVAWSGQAQLLDHCRRAAAKPTANNLPEIEMLAVLATPAVPADGETLLALMNNKTLKADRYALAGTLGRCEAVETLFEGMESQDPREAQAAGKAFARITGRTLRIDHRVKLPPADGHEPDEMEKHFLDIAEIPDVANAKSQWKDIKAKFTAGRHYSGGVDITETPADWREVDMQSRWEYHLRNAYYGKPHLTPVDLERYPLRLVPDPAAAAAKAAASLHPKSYLLWKQPPQG